MNYALKARLRDAYERDPEILCPKDKIEETLGSDPHYLNDILGLDKSDLIRLERLGFAMKARYVVKGSGEHRVRWLIFQEALDERS